MMKIRTPLMALVALVALAACGEDSEAAPSEAGQRVEITVTATGYEPSEVTANAGEPLTMVFTRNTEEGCGGVLAIPSEDIRRDLPLNEPVEVTITPTEAGTLRFTCGMDMYEGAIVVQ